MRITLAYFRDFLFVLKLKEQPFKAHLKWSGGGDAVVVQIFFGSLTNFIIF